MPRQTSSAGEELLSFFSQFEEAMQLRRKAEMVMYTNPMDGKEHLVDSKKLTPTFYCTSSTPTVEKSRHEFTLVWNFSTSFIKNLTEYLQRMNREHGTSFCILDVTPFTSTNIHTIKISRADHPDFKKEIQLRWTTLSESISIIGEQLSQIGIYMSCKYSCPTLQKDKKQVTHLPYAIDSTIVNTLWTMMLQI